MCLPIVRTHPVNVVHVSARNHDESQSPHVVNGVKRRIYELCKLWVSIFDNLLIIALEINPETWRSDRTTTLIDAMKNRSNGFCRIFYMVTQTLSFVYCWCGERSRFLHPHRTCHFRAKWKQWTGNGDTHFVIISLCITYIVIYIVSCSVSWLCHGRLTKQTNAHEHSTTKLKLHFHLIFQFDLNEINNNKKINIKLKPLRSRIVQNKL